MPKLKIVTKKIEKSNVAFSKSIQFPERPKNAHKSDFGTVGVLGGQVMSTQIMLGGPVLVAQSAMRTGAGLAVLAMPDLLVTSALISFPVAVGLGLPVSNKGILNAKESIHSIRDFPRDISVWAIGPGWGVGKAQQRIIRYLSTNTKPLVIDADGLNNICLQPKIFSKKKCPVILTPHVGEFMKLAKAFKLDLKSDTEQKEATQLLAKATDTIVVLKSSTTSVSDGKQTWELEGNNPALATAGTGDVLTGIVAGLVSQYYHEKGNSLSLFDTACLAVEAHSKAGELWSKENGDRGMLATDLIEWISKGARIL